MRPLRYSINLTLDGCCHHQAGPPPDEDSMRYWAAEVHRSDALLFGRATYELDLRTNRIDVADAGHGYVAQLDGGVGDPVLPSHR